MKVIVKGKRIILYFDEYFLNEKAKVFLFRPIQNNKLKLFIFFNTRFWNYNFIIKKLKY